MSKIRKTHKNTPLAQLVEHSPDKGEVSGSNPLWRTNKIGKKMRRTSSKSRQNRHLFFASTKRNMVSKVVTKVKVPSKEVVVGV